MTKKLAYSAEWRSVTSMGVDLRDPSMWTMFAGKDGTIQIVVSWGAMNALRYYTVFRDGHIEFSYPTYRNGDCTYQSRYAVGCEVDLLIMFMECGDPVVERNARLNNPRVADNAAAYRAEHGGRRIPRPAAWVL